MDRQTPEKTMCVGNQWLTVYRLGDILLIVA